MSRFRTLKAALRGLLQAPDWRGRLGELTALPCRETVGPLLSFLNHPGDLQARAVHALGLAVPCLAQTDMEAARNIMRRLMWSMNEESGNLGWGIPEAMAEIMANHERLAREFHAILLSYVTDTGKDDNYLDHPPLRRCAFRGVARLALARPDLAAKAKPALVRGLADEDVPSRGLAALALARLGAADEARPEIEALADNATIVELFRNLEWTQATVGELAREALAYPSH